MSERERKRDWEKKSEHHLMFYWIIWNEKKLRITCRLCEYQQNIVTVHNNNKHFCALCTIPHYLKLLKRNWEEYASTTPTKIITNYVKNKNKKKLKKETKNQTRERKTMNKENQYPRYELFELFYLSINFSIFSCSGQFDVF